jgi:hypothetical protein
VPVELAQNVDLLAVNDEVLEVNDIEVAGKILEFSEFHNRGKDSRSTSRVNCFKAQTILT